MNVAYSECLSWVPQRFMERQSPGKRDFNLATLVPTVSPQASGIKIVIEKNVVSWPE